MHCLHFYFLFFIFVTFVVSSPAAAPYHSLIHLGFYVLMCICAWWHAIMCARPTFQGCSTCVNQRRCNVDLIVCKQQHPLSLPLGLAVLPVCLRRRHLAHLSTRMLWFSVHENKSDSLETGHYVLAQKSHVTLLYSLCMYACVCMSRSLILCFELVHLCLYFSDLLPLSTRQHPTSRRNMQINMQMACKWSELDLWFLLQ